MTMVPSVPLEIVEDLQESIGVQVTDFSFSGGGCINHGGRIISSRGDFFLKWNSAEKFPGMFLAESKGLALLRSADAIHIPRVIHAGTAGQFQYLVLEFIGNGPLAQDYWAKFGSGLAAIHKNTSLHFGLDHNNYVGSLLQYNDRHSSWPDFFILQRLQPQIQIAFDDKKIDNSVLKKFERFYSRLPSLLTEEVPALLHGDLWSGNLLVDANGAPCLIDPAVYFGHREADLAMTQLFGGIDRSFLTSYDEIFPFVSGYPERFDIYNLYPLLVHLNLFGGGYESQVTAIVQRFL
jgi:fructosamine-3-kinase